MKDYQETSGKTFRAVIWPILICCIILLPGCTKEKNEGTITIAGSTTVLTIAQATAEEFMKEFPQYRVFVQGGGSSAGVEAAATGAAELGTISRELKDEELDLGLKATPIALDAIAVIINPNNRIDDMTGAQIRGIFSGKITNWKQLGGANEDIVLVNRDEASGTREAFSKIIMGGEGFTKDAVIQPGNGQVRSIVASSPAGIGYLSVGYVNDTVKTVAVDGVHPTIKNIRNGKYTIHRRLYVMTKPPVGELTSKFIDFLLSERIQSEIVSVEFVPIGQQ